MDDQRVGSVVRALRRRRHWRQVELAAKAGCSQGAVSLIERGHIRSLPQLRQVLAALDASMVIDLRWRAGALERLLDEDHARLVGYLVTLLRGLGWEVHAEVTYAEYSERGSIDVLAFHPRLQILLVIEVKTDLPSVEATLRKLDEKVRLAPTIARKRFGWTPWAVARLVAAPADRTMRRRVERQASVLEAALPVRGVAVRNWLAEPVGAIAGLWFVTGTNGRSAIQRSPGRERVRVRGGVRRDTKS
jgi:transcriptional regulator with XRE-family HTH domain